MNPYLIQTDLTKPVPKELYPAETPYTFPLDPFQQHAISAIHQGHNVLVCAKTGSGKTLVGEYQIYHSLAKGGRVFYTTPIKSLSNQKFHDLQIQYKGTSVGIMTGDIKFRPDAQIVVMTTEILRNLLYKQGTQTEGLGLSAALHLEGLDAVIFDECHYINDPDRGKVWEETMILLDPSVNLILLSATLNKPEAFASWLGSLKKVPIHLIQTSYRIVPLTHSVLGGTSGSDLLTILTSGEEVFQEKTYRDWLAGRKALVDAHRAFKDKVHNKVLTGVKGGVPDKVRIKSYPQQLNEAIEFLNRTHNLPALFFVFSRKGCEKYAALVERSLLHGAEQASVKHLMDSYLSHHKADLVSLPQYHTLRDLMCKGVAFHHSGMLPVLKEVVELLFGRGFIKVLFATETFAVGLNMPTKTVVFTSLTKFDEGGQRTLRTDEYIQMAGRAGRRGKDTEGLVLYLPEREAIEVTDLRQIMCGSKQPIRSRMNFHYDFLLKTIHTNTSSRSWLSIMENSYWFQQRNLSRIAASKTLTDTEAKIAAAEAAIPAERMALAQEQERLVADTVLYQQGRARKNAHRALQDFKEDNPGFLPAHATQYTEYKKLCMIRIDQRQEVMWLQDHAKTVEPFLVFLRSVEYLTPESDSKPPETLAATDLTLRGILATEVNEGNPILMTELFLSRKAHDLSGPELATVLSAFLEDFDKDLSITVEYVQVPDTTKTVLRHLTQIAKDFQKKEDAFYGAAAGSDKIWATTLQWTEPLYWWLTDTVHLSAVCAEYGIFEGNFVRGLLKLANILDEWLSLATYCEHADQIEKVTVLRSLLVRDLAVPDSLYLKA